jgi:hypothetical protein
VVADAHLIPRGHVEDAVHTFHRRAKGRGVCDVADVQLHAERAQERRFLGVSDERGHVMATPNQLLDELAAEKPGGSRDEIPRHAT